MSVVTVTQPAAQGAYSAAARGLSIPSSKSPTPWRSTMIRTAGLTAVPLAAAILLGSAGSALAIPQGDPGNPPPPPNQAPNAALTVSPNPALVSRPLVLSPVTTAKAAKLVDINDTVLGRNQVTF